jgi:cbb3-type cytochrome oxidase subunit 3
MKLSDVVSHAGLALYAEIALILFFGVFVAVLLRTWRPSDRDELEAQRMLPLEPETPADPREGAAR